VIQIVYDGGSEGLAPRSITAHAWIRKNVSFSAVCNKKGGPERTFHVSKVKEILPVQKIQVGFGGVMGGLRVLGEVTWVRAGAGSIFFFFLLEK